MRGPPIISEMVSQTTNGTDAGQTSEVGRVICAKKKVKPRLTRPVAAGPLVMREGAHVTNFDVMPKEDPHDIKGKGKAEDEPIPKKRNRPTTNQGGRGEPEDARGQTTTNMVVIPCFWT